MSRDQVRSFKRAVREGLQADHGPQRLLGQDCALALLARSISFGHGRLAVLRLCAAVEAGAKVPSEHWLYCSRVATMEQDRKLQGLYQSAVAKASVGVSLPPT